MADVTISQLGTLSLPGLSSLIPINHNNNTSKVSLSSITTIESHDLLAQFVASLSEGSVSGPDTSANYNTGASLTNKIFHPLDGGSSSWTIVGNLIRNDSLVGSHHHQSGRLFLTAGTYRLLIQTRPSETGQVSNYDDRFQGYCSSDHAVYITTDAPWTAPNIGSNYQYVNSSTIIGNVHAPRARASTSLGAGIEPYESRKIRSSIYYSFFNINTSQFCRVCHRPDPYSGGTGLNTPSGGYKYYIEKLLLEKIYG